MLERLGSRLAALGFFGVLGLAACAGSPEELAGDEAPVTAAPGTTPPGTTGTTPKVGVGKRILFDAAHAQTAGNADWVIDADSCGRAQRFPTPPVSSITESSPENTWTGGFSAFGIALAKAGYDLESLPTGKRITYGDPANEQDLTKFDVFISPEPNTRFGVEEKKAIARFVENGGGFFMIADHAIADRDNDGWAATGIFNDLIQSEMPVGIHFAMRGEPGSDITERHAKTYTQKMDSPILYTGPFGSVGTKGFMLVGSTVMVLDPTVNPSVTGHIWFRRARPDTLKDVVHATATYGRGRIAAVGDSSPCEDLTASCGRTYIGFDDPSHDNALILMNTVAWITPEVSVRQ